VRRAWLVLTVVVVIAGCAGKKPVVPADKLRAEADEAYKDEAYEVAVERYKALLDQYPFDPDAEEAELHIAFAHYRAERYAEAIASFGDFERMHPTSPNLAMVEYQLGMAYLAQATTADRDTQAVTNALTYFRNLQDRFPGSEWALRATLRIEECREALAGHEAVVAAYYLKQGNLMAAESRLTGVLNEYADTDAAADMLYRFAQAYARRNEQPAEVLALATLIHHHPDGPLAEKARTELTQAGGAPNDTDPLPQLLAHLESVRAQADRQELPHPVSAYPEGPPGGRTY
jgi:outer membrane protein assembly factor BamD